MRIRQIIVAVSLTLVAFVENSWAQPAPGGRFVTGEILLKFRPSVSAAAKADAHQTAGGRMVAEIPRTNVQLVAVTRGDELSVIGRYRLNPNVLYAEPNFIRRIPSLTTHSGGTELIPGDYHFREQWALHNTGQEFYCFLPGWCFYIAKADADIDAPEAWAVTTGVSTNIKVAVIDSGIDYTHPDLISNYAGGDDFTSPDRDPMDDHGHGTHVSGTIAAAMNNLTGALGEEEGVVGVAPNALILAYKVCTSDGSCTDFAIEQAIARAITDGAKVINMSLGAAEFSQSGYDAVQDAWNAGVVIVAAAGNNGTTDRFYPAAYDNVVSVAASDEDDKRAYFSTYGSWVDLSAPGNEIFSTYPTSACGGLGTTPGETGCYTWNSGTSMASPHVAGAAALLSSRGVTTNSEIVNILLTTADRQGVDPVRLDSWTIHGRLNLHNAISNAASINLPPQANAGPDQTVIDSDGDNLASVTLNGSASTDTDGTIVRYEWSEGSTLVAVGASPTVLLGIGAHTMTLNVTDDLGGTGEDNVTITVNAAPAPPAALTVTGISPNVVPQNYGTKPFVISGTGFAAGASVSFANGAGSAPRVISVSFNSSTQLTATVEVRSGGPKKNRVWDVVVTNPSGGTAAGVALLTITP